MIPVKDLLEELTPRECSMLLAAVGHQQDYARRNLDRSKQPEATNNWATFCVELKRIRDKLEKAIANA